MPPRRKPCSPQTRRLSKYKQIARKKPPNSTETLVRHRYKVNPKGNERPCVLAGDGEAGRTNCYAPTAHSRRRKTCELLVDPDHPLHDFAPGMYLVGGPRIRFDPVVCTAHDVINFGDPVHVDTRSRSGTSPGPLPDEHVVVLGPYVHPVTSKLTVKCILLSSFEDVYDLDSFGNAFQSMDASERGVMVPSAQMIFDFMDDLSEEKERMPWEKYIVLHSILFKMGRQIEVREQHLENLDKECSKYPELERSVRTLCKSFYEMALYFRRYAGPGQVVPLDLLREVGTASNPISSSLKDKFVSSFNSGIRLSSSFSPGSLAADLVLDPEGTLTNMSQAHANTIKMIFITLKNRWSDEVLGTYHQSLVKKAFQLGTPFRIIDGSGRFYPGWKDPNFYDGNPASETMNLFDLCFGTPTPTPEGFSAHVSVYGTGEYCVQLAAIQIIRSVQTVLPYVYKTRPAWALVDGEFDNVHT